jgi:hypothetical protein
MAMHFLKVGKIIPFDILGISSRYYRFSFISIIVLHAKKKQDWSFLVDRLAGLAFANDLRFGVAFSKSV